FTSLACFSYLTLLVLLSFPTRRSSDLDRLVKRFLSNQVMYDNLLLLPLPVQPSVGLLVKLQAVRQAKPDDDIAARLQVQAMPGADRKSTRLNSSHVKISYAVFCLKKKT